MSNREIAARLVQMCKEGQLEAAARELYASDIVSIEGASMGDIPARIDGLDGVLQKGAWWEANHEVHSMQVSGPFIGHREDQFAVQFDMDLTPKGGERNQMSEVALYTTKNGKIVQEAILYQS
jgi:hypothetical protein